MISFIFTVPSANLWRLRCSSSRILGASWASCFARISIVARTHNFLSKSIRGASESEKTVNGVSAWASREVLNQYDVALRLVHLHVEYPSAVGRGGEVRAVPKRL